MSVLLGFEAGSGHRVEIPLGHMVCTGQTQESGKTTALEAVITRSGCKAIAFVTKRGESSFQVARKIPPYFAEPTDDAEHPLWMWVKGILEANQQRKMVFEESHIIIACRTPRLAGSLEDVHANIKELLHGKFHIENKAKKTKQVWDRRPARGISESIYTQLDAYFAIVLPQLRRLPSSKALELHKGVNVMDLSAYAIQTQALVMRSVLEWVYRHEQNTIVIIPEAWEFVPQGKNSPVRMAAEIFIRKAAAMKNFLWIDSQDTAGVNKLLLRNIKVWLFGVQREKNECDRVLDSIPDLKPKPTRTMLQTLEKGHFYACWEREIRLVYVQPAWMASEAHAQAIARGELPIESARDVLDEFREKRGPEDEENETEISEIAGRETPGGIFGDMGSVQALRAGEDRANIKIGDPDGASESEAREEMEYKEKYDALKTEYDQLVKAHHLLKLAAADIDPGSSRHSDIASVADGVPLLIARNGEESFESFYQALKARAVRDKPSILSILVAQPELRINIAHVPLDVDGKSLIGQCGLLLKDGFFATPKPGTQAKNEVLRRFANKTPTTNLYTTLDKLVAQGFLLKEADGYCAVQGMKISVQELRT